MTNHAYTIVQPDELSAESRTNEQFALDVLMGLSATRKSLPTKYIYDQAGSALFQQIMDLDEYYLTNCELEILNTHAAEIVDCVRDGLPITLVELGAGDGRKTNVLLAEFMQRGLPFEYMPIDISEAAISGLVRSTAAKFSTLRSRGLVADYFDGVRWITQNTSGHTFALFLGSTIGNFNGPETRVFLRTLWNALDDGDYVLIGFDLKKDIDALLHAYNDEKGVTARFNKNILSRINRELDGNFKLDQFQHFGTYDVFEGAMKSYLVSLTTQDVDIPAVNKQFHFAPFEPVHLEYSFKYLPEQIRQLADDTGFHHVKEFVDSRNYFMDALWRIEK